MNLLCYSLESSNEKNERQQKDEVLESNVGKRRLRQKVRENRVGLPMYDSSQNGMEHQANTRQVWSGKQNKNDIKVGSVIGNLMD